MRYKAVVMAPSVIEFECEGDDNHIRDTAMACCTGFDVIMLSDMEFGPILAAIIPKEDSVANPLVSDPPPMAA